ncbi:ParB/Srx family N-terminal domain-containing protein [Atopobium minutum]|uniref:ParB-like nuclease domain-containing protein n=1 Tax=Atopobium minutum TaxID=1381 RepID=A0AB38A4U9_9ACTN|nr:ParB/Srx family N-terminal domain-containing protein [Atopobium minutum]SEB43911.1 ParB-like nuclease domain-containing protein [Atopobium minutum]
MRPMPKIEVTELPVDELVPYANNAKEHPQKQIDEIAESISTFGNCDPIGVWHNEDGEPEIVEGHGRVLALKKLGITTAPVIYLDHLTDEQRRAYTHVHNQTTMSSGFDYDTLVADMDNLNMDWEALGFEEFCYKESSFNAIENLMNDKFAENSLVSKKDSFSITLVFPSDVKELINSYIKEVGKDEIVSNIIKEAQSWE